MARKKKTPEAIALERIREAARDGATRLDLVGLGLTALPPEIGQLTTLTHLALSGNALTALPPEIGQLTKLEYLGLVYNQLTALPPEIGQLTTLTHLYLDRSQLTALPPEIGQLTKLTYLDLNGNQLTALPPEIGQLTKLMYLNLNGNQLTALPPEIGQLTKLAILTLNGNPLTSPPPEVVEQGTTAILAYLREQAEGEIPQWVAKLVLVGEGGVGKTCLLNALLGEPFDPQSATTHGIRVEPLKLTHPTEPDTTMTLNCWDFGGQQIYHATHQFFLSNRSVFVLVWNARIGYQQSKLYDWLEQIEARAPDSPILLVATHCEERDPDLPLKDLEAKFPHLVPALAVSSSTGEGIATVRDAIADTAAGLETMGRPWPRDWLSAADDIRTTAGSSITAAGLRDTFTGNGVAADAVDVLARTLHELGDILYYPDDDELRDLILLDPQWVTEQISAVLSHPEIIEGHGVFRREHMDQVWADLDERMRSRLLRLMEKFDLSYRIPDDPENKSLVVERLSLDAADYPKPWNAIQETPGCREISMRFKLGVKRPPGIPTWFIARSYRFTTETHWRYGALFGDIRKKPRHLALVHAPPSDEQSVTLTVRGPSPHSFFTLLRDGLELTLERYPGVDIERTIPCPGHDREPCPHEFDYGRLIARTELDPPKYQVECQQRFEDVDVRQLLFGLAPSTLDAVLERIAEIAAAAKEHREELRALRELTQREFTKLFDRDQRLEESHTPNVFVVRPHEGRGWVAKLLAKLEWPAQILGTKLDLQLYCAAPGQWHPTGENGWYPIAESAKWLIAMAPYLRVLVGALKYASPLMQPALAVALPNYEKVMGNDLKLMGELVKKLPDIESEGGPGIDLGLKATEGSKTREAYGAQLRILRNLLDEKDPPHVWGGLRKVLTPEGHYLWLCEHHAKEYLR